MTPSITPAKQLVDTAMAEIETLSVDDALAFDAETPVVLVDIRDVREVNKLGKIPGAVHAPRGMLEFWVDPQSPYFREEFDTDKKLVLYCALGWRSALATKTLQDMGVSNVAHIGGGFTGWQEAGGTIEFKEKKPSQG